MTNNSLLKDKLIISRLKVTPQRLALLDALEDLKNHPTAEQIIEFIKRNHPNIATGTVYKTLLTFVEKGLVKKVTTENDVMRFDAITEKHYHLYFVDSETITDYFDDELNDLLTSYFKQKSIPNMQIEEIKLQIVGKKLK